MASALAGPCALIGAGGAVLMFVADLILYLPHKRDDWSTRIYFSRIDPSGTDLIASPMATLSDQRLMLGGVLGPVAALPYVIGFLQIPLACWGAGGLPRVCSVAAAACLAGMMVAGGTYHALFPFTGFLAKGRVASPLLAKHQAYLRCLYRAAAYFGFMGRARGLPSAGEAPGLPPLPVPRSCLLWVHGKCGVYGLLYE